MLRIVRAEILDGEILNVELNNRNLILLNLRPLLQTAPYAALRRETLIRPMTDGQNVYWRDGPALSLPEIFSMLGDKGTKEE